MTPSPIRAPTGFSTALSILRGIPVNFAAFDAGDGKGEQWLADFTTQLRVTLPKDSYILTHAHKRLALPYTLVHLNYSEVVSLWFSATHDGSGGDLKVHEIVGDMIDQYNVQFYNRTDEYTTCDDSLNMPPETWNGTYSKLPTMAWTFLSSSSESQQQPAMLRRLHGSGHFSNLPWDCQRSRMGLSAAERKHGGAMVWKYPHEDESWIGTVGRNYGRSDYNVFLLILHVLTICSTGN
ncbi:hypothetical protein EDD18DRAFT_1328339 [Armillaria luteobubalina]|uniref:Uncharacterized protein n=1 Tax=Armillaria luteobubalina TaxID=153913 RepID=A0AA39QGP1_9AGAR|nr:hypothetical protein EDD18DRAFT_1328339 [Armillaria luteobubalina]